MERELTFIYLIPPNTNVNYFGTGSIERSNLKISEHRAIFDASPSFINTIEEQFVFGENSIVIYPEKGDSFNSYDAGWYKQWPEYQNKMSIEVLLDHLTTLQYRAISLPIIEQEGFINTFEFRLPDEIVFRLMMSQLRKDSNNVSD